MHNCFYGDRARRKVVNNYSYLKFGKSYDLLFKSRLLIFVLVSSISFFSKMWRLNALTAFLWFPYFVILFKTNGYFFFRYIALYLYAFLALTGLYCIENNTFWLSELRLFSKYEGAFPLYSSYYMAFLLTLEFFDSNFRHSSHSIVSFEYRYCGKNLTRELVESIVFLCVLLTAISFSRVLLHPNFSAHLDRFEYLELYVCGIWRKIRGWLMYFVPFLLIGINLLKKKVLPLAAVGFLLFYLAWTGERFTGFSQIIFLSSSFLMLCNEARSSQRFRAKRFPVLPWIVLIIVFLSFVFFNAVNQYGGSVSSERGLEIFYQRIAQQGQLWWRTFSQFSGQMPHFLDIGDEAIAFTDPNSPTPYYGIYKIMYLCAPKDVVTAKIALGQNYTESSGASIYYYFGRVGLFLFAFLMGWVFAKITFYYDRSIIESRIVESFLWARLLFVMLNILIMSRFYLLLRPSTLLFLFGALLLNFLKIKRKTPASIMQTLFYRARQRGMSMP